MKDYSKKRKTPKNPLMDFDLWLSKAVKPTTKTEQPQNFRAIVYVRVSSERQAKEWHWLEGQAESGKTWCRLNGDMPVDKTFKDEGISWKIMDRKGLIDAIEYLEKQNKKYTKITHFVCTEICRIARPEDREEGTALIARIEATGAKIVTTLEHRDTSTDEGKLMDEIKLSIGTYERKKIMKRARNWRISRALQGFRPFPTLPVGYKKEGQGQTAIVIKDDFKAGIIKEGLELFACNVLITRADLLEFFRDKWLTTNEKNYKGKLWSSFIEKTFLLHRLFFYAGYIFYPDWDINEPIEWRQPAITSLDVIYKIIEKLQKGSLLKRNPRRVEMSAEFPLRGVIYCPACHRKLTSWYSKSWTGNKFAYYGCSYKDCTARENIPKEMLENDFKDLLNKYKLPDDFLPAFKIILKEEREASKQNEHSLRDKKMGMKVNTENKMKDIWDAMMKTKNVDLYANLEKERAELNSEKLVLEDDLSNDAYTEQEYMELYEKTLWIITNPLAFWTLGNAEIKQLLLAVRFGWKLYYNKKSGYRTNDTWLLNYLLGILGTNKTHLLGWLGIEPRTTGLKGHCSTDWATTPKQKSQNDKMNCPSRRSRMFPRWIL
ncbi:MAG: Resolvase-like protein [uncultured bacterium (gcode 4)]|uniref:Resolvase-like protein n=1 Tax=uncultured bacterium (gcode 4) TaxID=1234023 RepID=K1XIS0_9BACT|nr:MAG: Resolvase-like protein [uncultured bacterium (gcode 4)]